MQRNNDRRPYPCSLDGRVVAENVNPESALPMIERSPLQAISSEEELRTLLRSRLLLVNGLFLTPMLIVIVVAHFDPIGRADTTLAGYLFLYGLAGVFFASSVTLVLHPKASLTTLRLIETLLFGAATLGILLDQYLWLGTGWLEGVAVEG